MNLRWIRGWLAGVASGMFLAVSYSATLPVRLDSLAGGWETAQVQKEVAPTITLECIATHLDGPYRLIFLSSPKTSDQPEALRDFALRLLHSFTAYQTAIVTERDTNRMGYAGLDVRLNLVSDKNSLDCVLFAFADQETWWGILHSKPKDAPASADAAFALLHQKPSVPAGVVTMEPLVVKGQPISDFPINIEITRTPAGDRVAEVRVTKVPPGTDTARAGVQEGDTIIAIDGRKIEEFSAGVGKDSEIGRIFLNRELGDTVKLEILPAGATKSFSVTLHVRRRQTQFDVFRIND